MLIEANTVHIPTITVLMFIAPFLLPNETPNIELVIASNNESDLTENKYLVKITTNDRLFIYIVCYLAIIMFNFLYL